MMARIVVTVVFIGAVCTLGSLAGCSASQPYGLPGVRLYAALNNKE